MPLHTNAMPMTSETRDFQTLLTEIGIEFRPTPDFVLCSVRENSVFRYQHAMRSPSGNLEVRYRIDAFAQLEIERKAANAGMEALASVGLDQMHSANFMALVSNLSGGMSTEPTVLKAETTALLYGADWSALAFMRLANHDFSPDYDSAYVLAIHKDGVGDFYVIGLFDDIGSAICVEAGSLDKHNLPPDVKSYLAPTLRFT
jgi:hypothetical protein